MHNPQTDRPPLDLDHWRHDVGNTLTVISARTRLQQRLTLRSSGLPDQERNQTLANLEAVLAAVEELTMQIDGLRCSAPMPHRASPSEKLF